MLLLTVVPAAENRIQQSVLAPISMISAPEGMAVSAEVPPTAALVGVPGASTWASGESDGRKTWNYHLVEFGFNVTTVTEDGRVLIDTYSFPEGASHQDLRRTGSQYFKSFDDFGDRSLSPLY